MTSKLKTLEWAVRVSDELMHQARESIKSAERALITERATTLEKGEYAKRVRLRREVAAKTILELEGHRAVLLDMVEQEKDDIERSRVKGIEEAYEAIAHRGGGERIEGANMGDLPVGTLLWVENGHWEGSIIERGGEKFIQVRDDDERAWRAEGYELDVWALYPHPNGGYSKKKVDSNAVLPKVIEEHGTETEV